MGALSVRLATRLSATRHQPRLDPTRPQLVATAVHDAVSHLYQQRGGMPLCLAGHVWPCRE